MMMNKAINRAAEQLPTAAGSATTTTGGEWREKPFRFGGYTGHHGQDADGLINDENW